MSTSGYSYNRNINKKKKYIESQSLPWTCFYANIDDMKKVKIEDEEIWLNKKDYTSMDDQVMFYKAYLMGFKTCIVTDATYVHLDGRTSRKSLEKKFNVAYATEFNRYIFWHRFIYKRDKGIKKI